MDAERLHRNSMAGLAVVLTALAMLVGGQAVRVQQHEHESAAEQCEMALQLAGAPTTMNERGISAALADLDDPAGTYERLSLAIAACKGFRLERFCAGPACGGIRLALEYVGRQN